MNCYGSRVLTSGIDLEQYGKNPVLLWMHRRSYEPGAMPIGRVENLRLEGDKLIGTPVFDQADDFAKQIESKWENGFLRMASAGLEIVATSPDPALVMPGQTRETVTQCKLIEVSIVDIGGNDEALQLYGEGKRLTLAAGEETTRLPLLRPNEQPEAAPEEPAAPEGENETNNNKPQTAMTKEQKALLGLPETATDEQVTAALTLMKGKADGADALALSAVTHAVDQAVADKKILAAQRDHYINLGKTAGLQMLTDTLNLMQPQHKPTDEINLSKGSAATPGGSPEKKDYAKLSDVPDSERMELRKNDPAKYAALFKAEYGIECPALD